MREYEVEITRTIKSTVRVGSDSPDAARQQIERCGTDGRNVQTISESDDTILKVRQVADLIDEYKRRGGPLPADRMGVFSAAFWSGYSGIAGISIGAAGSNMRRAWAAGKARYKAEPGLHKENPRVE